MLGGGGEGRGGGEGGGKRAILVIMYDRRLNIIDARITAMPGRGLSGCHRPGENVGEGRLRGFFIVMLTTHGRVILRIGNVIICGIPLV